VYEGSARAREAIVAAAQGMISGEIDLLDGCRLIVQWRAALNGVDAELPALDLVTGIESELDTFPVGPARQEWDTAVLARQDERKAEYLQGVRGTLLEACATLIAAWGS
jgi:hypothetical protein